MSATNENPEVVEIQNRKADSPATIGSARLFANGQIVVTDNNGNQIGELQLPLLVLFARRACRLGYNPDGMIFVDSLERKWKIIKGTDDWNFQETQVPNADFRDYPPKGQ